MRVRDLRATLENIRSIFKAAGATAQEKALGKVAFGLESHDDAPLEPYLEEVTRKTAEATAPLAERFASRLKSVEFDEEKFKTVIHELQQIRNLKKSDVQKIAAAYAGSFDRRASIEKLINDINLTLYTKLYERDSRKIAGRANPV